MQPRPNGMPMFDKSMPFSAADVRHPSSRLIMVSNRGPVEHSIDNDGQLTRRGNGGGLATALASLTPGNPVTWIASAASPADRMVAAGGQAIQLNGGTRLQLITLPPESYDLYYGTFCNPILWFLQHSLWDRLQRPNLEQEALHSWQKGYLPVNQTFAEAVVEELDRGDGPGRVMLHDYHLYAAPLFIRNLRPDTTLQQFIHIPWPGPEAWQRLPRPIVESICAGLLANDSVVFQTNGSVRNFLLTCQTFLSNVRLDHEGTGVWHDGHRTRVWANPVSVDIWDLRSRLSSPEAAAYREKFSIAGDVQTIVRVDRLDPSKNVAAGFRAYDRLLEQHPEWIGKVRFIALLVPSRTNIAEYQTYAQEVFAEAEAVNARHGRPDWTPITVIHEHNRLQALVAMSLYDVLLVNPVVDGMNLVSKEGPVLNSRNGVLVLSSTAGSFAELQGAALAIHPEDVDGTAEALHTALSLPGKERHERAQRLREAVLRHDLRRWLQRLVEDFDRGQNAPERQAGTATARGVRS